MLVNSYFGVAYEDVQDMNISLSLDGANHTDVVNKNTFLPTALANKYAGVTTREYQIYTNMVQNPTSSLSISYTGGSGISARNTVVRVLRVGDTYVPYTDCELEVLVLWVG